MRSEEYRRRKKIIERAMDILEERGFEDIDKITDYDERDEKLSQLRKEVEQQLKMEFGELLPKDVVIVARMRLRGKLRRKRK